MYTQPTLPNYAASHLLTLASLCTLLSTGRRCMKRDIKVPNSIKENAKVNRDHNNPRSSARNLEIMLQPIRDHTGQADVETETGCKILLTQQHSYFHTVFV